MRIFLAPFIYWFAVHGFLLEPDHTSRPGSNNQCLTFESFLAEKKALEREIEQKHLESDQTIGVLTSQLQKKFSALEEKIEKVDHENDTSIILEKLEMKYRDLSYNNTLTEGKLQNVINENRLKDSEIASLRNTSLKLEKELSDLKMTKAVQNIVDLQTLQQQMNSVQQQISLLTSNQNARNQDFLALHNLTVNSDAKMMSQLQTFDSKITNQLHSLDSKTMNQLQNIERNQSLSFNAVNSKMVSLQNQVSDNSKKVALTACVASTKTYNGPVIFAEIKINTGINNIESFRSTGKFKVLTSGLYFVSVYIRSNTNNYAFYLKRNGTIIVQSATSAYSGWSPSSIVSIVVANENDMIYVHVDGGGIHIESGYSCLSIIKVK